RQASSASRFPWMSLRTRMRTQHRTKGRLYDGMRAGRWIDYRAARPVTGRHLGERRKLSLAVEHAVDASGLKGAAGQLRMAGRHAALDGGERTPAIGLERRDSL